MDRQDDLFRQERDREREEQKKARKEKWEKREKSFWKSFLLTEDGKPKSGLFIYTFCLSFVFLGVYIAAFYIAIEGLAAPMAGLPPFWSNLLQSLVVSVVGALLCALLHLLLTDKRLVFRTYLWLVVYAVACIITLMVMLGDWGAIQAMLAFCAWFVLIPLAVGIAVSFLLYRRDYVRPAQSEEKPEWKKYTERR